MFSSDTKERFKNFSYGLISGITSRTITQPYEMVKIRKQTGTANVYESSLSIIRSITNNEGFLALWKGNLANSIRIGYQNGLLFLAYHQTKKWSNDLFPDNKLACSIFSGSVSGLLGGIAALPLEITRTRLSIQTKDPIYRSVFDGLNQMRKIGIREFFHGLTPTMMGFVPFCGINYSVFYYLQDNFTLDKRSYWFNLQNLIYGTISAICALAIVYPTDCLRKKMHLQNFKSTDNPVMQYDNFRHCFKSYI